jgi:thioredoxin 2
MSSLGIDGRGLIVTCPQCGQNNRLAFERLDGRPRCAKCRNELPPPAQPIDIEEDGSFVALTTRSALPVLVDFWAEWCGPCKMIAPEIAKIATQLAGRAIVAKVNTEMLPQSARRFSVSSIPLLVVCRGGGEVARQAGAMPAASILKMIQPHLL